jgi:hypothetical protein
MEPEGTPARSPPLRCSSEGYPESIRRAWDAKGLYFTRRVFGRTGPLFSLFTILQL